MMMVVMTMSRVVMISVMMMMTAITMVIGGDD